MFESGRPARQRDSDRVLKNKGRREPKGIYGKILQN